MWYPPWYGLSPADAVHMAAGMEDGLPRMVAICGPESVNEQNSSNGWTALHRSAAEGDVQRVRQLLAFSAGVAAPAHNGETPLQLALAGGHTDVLDALLEAAPWAAEARLADGGHPLHRAVTLRQAAAVRLLLQAAPAVVYERDAWNAVLRLVNFMPIHIAAQLGDAPTFAALLAAAPDTATATATEMGTFMEVRPLHLAARGGHQEGVALLLAAAPQVATAASQATPLYLAASGGHTQVVRQLVHAAPEAAMQACEGWRQRVPLHAAVEGGCVEMVGCLVDAAPAALLKQDGNWRTPLHLALHSHQPSQTQTAVLQRLLPALAALGDGDRRDADQLLLRELDGCLAAGNLRAARALLACVRCTLPLLELLSDYDVGGSGKERSLFADLVQRQPLSQAEWDAVPFPCPGLASALPTVLARSEAEAGQLVAHLSPGEQRCLRTAALCLLRASRRQLPAPLSSRILAEALASPLTRQALERQQRQRERQRQQEQEEQQEYARWQYRPSGWPANGATAGQDEEDGPAGAEYEH